MTAAIQVDIPKDGIATLTIDCPGLKVNKLSTPVMEAFRDALQELKGNVAVKLLLIRSGKADNYIAGADIQEIKSLVDPASGYEAARMGQGVMDLLSSMPFPTVAVIHGAAVGGGLELALACDFRIATDHSRTQLGLPEVNLGIIPGFGGTQRLPRLIGLTRALPLILSGKMLSGKDAFKKAVVDACVPLGYLEFRVREFANAVLYQQSREDIILRRKQKGVFNWFLNTTSLGRLIVYSQAKKSLMAKTKGHYPAPLSALKVVRQSIAKSLEDGLKIEAEAFSELVPTDISKNLVSLFFMQEAMKKETGVSQDVAPKPLNRMGVLGAGLMGGGIAWLFSFRKGLVRLKDVNWNGIELGLQAAQKIYGALTKRRKLTKNQAALNLQKLSGTLDYSGFDQVDVVVEAVVENMAIKQSVFKELEANVSEDTIVCSNTSSLSITEMATAFKRPERFCGMHFFSPVNRMPLVEVIPHEGTSSETIASIVRLSKELGKTPVVVQDCPGFLVNRLLIPYVNEAVYLLQDGLDIPTIDRIAEAFGMPLGPLALADEVGLDVGYKVAQILEEGYGSRMKVATSFEQIHGRSDLLGKKSKLGFYDHRDPSKKKQVNMDVYDVIAKTARPAVTEEECLDRLFLIMVNEAARCIQERVVASPEHLDIAMIMGTGFPPFRGGLCRYADQRGLTEIVEALTTLSQTVGDRFEPADLLVDMAKSGTRFYS